MRVHYEESGGFAGLSRGCELDTNNLAPADRTLLESLVEPLEGSIDSHSAHARDALQYKVTIDTGDRTLRISVDDVTVPTIVRPILKFLQKHAKPKPIS